MKLRIRARARRDLDSILDYSEAEHGSAKAVDYLRMIGAMLARLEEHPGIGIARPDLAPSMRSVAVGEHRIFYLVLADRISVVRVLHKAMDVSRHL